MQRDWSKFFLSLHVQHDRMSYARRVRQSDKELLAYQSNHYEILIAMSGVFLQNLQVIVKQLFRTFQAEIIIRDLFVQNY